MSAIATLLLTFVRPGDVIVHSGPLYAATETLIDKILGQFGVNYLDFPAGATREEIDAVHRHAPRRKGKVSLIYLESPANPTNALVDVEAVPAARDAAFGADELPPIAIDNTFLGPLWAKPLEQGADISVYSLTKYAGGHSATSSPAALAGSKALLDQVRMIRNTMGGDLRPQHRVDAAAQPRNARTAHEPRRRECRQGVRLPARPSQGRDGRLSRLPRGRIAPGRHLQPPLHSAPDRPSRSI